MSTSALQKRLADGETVPGDVVGSVDDAPVNEKALAADETFAGPAPDLDGEAAPLRVVDPLAGIEPVAAPSETLLRFITCGSVDDGKSTLIGRLLFETDAVFDDQMEALERDSKKFGTTGGDLDFALLVDGLSAEREQGITIDVAYRYFSARGRAFIIADTPGHEQYTRNMATGASQAELAVILVDARKGILPQTRRHSFITSMVGIKSVVVAVNKMDLVGWSEATFEAIKREYQTLLPALGFTDIVFVPLSAKLGDNLAERSPNTPWYAGPTLLDHLATVRPATFDESGGPFRFPVQWVNRPNLDFRGFSGTVASGVVSVGARVKVLASGQVSTVKAILGPDGDQSSAEAGESVTISLSDEIDASRGDVIALEADSLVPQRRIDADILWMVERPLVAGGRFVARIASAQTPATVRALNASVDIHTYEDRPANALLANGIGRVTITLDRPTVVAPYGEARELGAFILVDPLTNETVALGLVRRLVDVDAQGAEPVEITAPGEAPPASPFERRARQLRSLWLARPAMVAAGHSALVASRAASSLVLVALFGIVLGLPILAALLLGALDFVLRPFLHAVVVKAWERRSVRIGGVPGQSDVRDGEGI